MYNAIIFCSITVFAANVLMDYASWHEESQSHVFLIWVCTGMPVRWSDSGLEDWEIGVKIPGTGDSLDSPHAPVPDQRERDRAIVWYPDPLIATRITASSDIRTSPSHNLSSIIWDHLINTSHSLEIFSTRNIIRKEVLSMKDGRVGFGRDLRTKVKMLL